MAFDLFEPDQSVAIKPALAIELFHNFTLMHDDIMDSAPIRRVKEAVHLKWNVNTAILSGDAMLIESYKALLKCDAADQQKVIDAFSKMASEVCEGQQKSTLT